MSINTNGTIVLDNGSGIIKAGFLNDEIPKCVVYNQAARTKSGDIKKEIIIGSTDVSKKLSIKYPMEHGVINDWDVMEKVWQYIYGKNHLSVFSEEHPILFTEAALNPRCNREKVAEIFFESFCVPAMYISIPAVLTLYSTGRITGVVLDSGDGVTCAVPIYEGFTMPESIKRIDFAGREVTQYLRMLLKKEGFNFHGSSDFEIIRKIKETTCYIASKSDNKQNLTGTCSYELPDGKIIEVAESRFRAPEVLFNPEFLGKECLGLHENLCASIEESDLDLRNTLFKNIILSGGSTLFKGFGNRLLVELKNICPKRAQLKISAPKERLYSAWIGGSVLASLDTFKDALVSKQMYEENGKKAFHMTSSNILLDHYYAMLNKPKC